MHLLEACLSLARLIRRRIIWRAQRASSSLFHTRFTVSEGGLLGEKFLPDWSMPTGAAAEIVEPGHQFEWVWLLHTHARAAGGRRRRRWRASVSVPPLSMRPGALVREVTRAGAPHDASRRTWPQTEALKAHLAMFEQRGEELRRRCLPQFRCADG